MTCIAMTSAIISCLIVVLTVLLRSCRLTFNLKGHVTLDDNKIKQTDTDIGDIDSKSKDPACPPDKADKEKDSTDNDKDPTCPTGKADNENDSKDNEKDPTLPPGKDVGWDIVDEQPHQEGAQGDIHFKVLEANINGGKLHACLPCNSLPCGHDKIFGRGPYKSVWLSLEYAKSDACKSRLCNRRECQLEFVKLQLLA